MLWNSQPVMHRKVCFLSTFPPRKCGIAVFTKDLIDHYDLVGEFAPAKVIAVTKKGATDSYGKRVGWQIKQEEEKDYFQIAKKINSSSFDLINIQHEFGIFGGEYGRYILSFLEKLTKPVVTTLHTVQPDFNSEALEVIREIIFRSDAVVVTGSIAANTLAGLGFSIEKINVIQHGCPDIPLQSSEKVKRSLNLAGRTVLCTFGLISRGKGIEYAIKALPSIVSKHPEVLYLIIGETHPEVKRLEDEYYRNGLVRLVKELGLQDNVEFQNRFLPKSELIKYLQATDVYITPYISRNQISSGTLIYALGTGRAVVSTPYIHAQEVLADGRGIFCEFKNSASIARAINKLLDDRRLKAIIEKKAYVYSRNFTWYEVAKRYAQLFRRIIKYDMEEESIELSSSNA